MKTFPRFFLYLVIAASLAVADLSRAQQAPAAPSKSDTPAPAAPADATAIPAPTPAAPVAEPALPEPPKPEAAPKPPEEKPLRVIATDTDAAPDEPGEVRRGRRRHSSSDFPFGNHVVPKGSRMRDAISVFGSTSVDGDVDSDVVSVFGDTTIGPDAKIGGAAVAVLGRLESQGNVGQEAVTVLGGGEINGHVRGEAVCVLGNLHLGPKAVIEGDIVVVGGKLTRDPAAIVHGNQVNVPILGGFADIDWLTTWVKRCLLYGRPLAFGHNLGWAWAIAFSFLAFYLLLALLFPAGIVKCAETFERRPGYSILASILTVLLAPVAIVLLAVTVVGALLVPFLGIGLLFAGLFGKAVMLAWVGRRFTRARGEGVLGNPVLAVLIGGLFILLIYTVPVLGFVTYKLLSWLGLGVVVYTIALSMRREKRPASVPGNTPPPSTPPPFASPVPPPAPVAPLGVVPPPSVSADFTGAESGGGVPNVPPAPDVGPAPVPPTMNDLPSSASDVPPPEPPSMGPPVVATFPPRPTVAAAVAWQRAGFFIRLGAMALDGVLVGLVLGFISGMAPNFLRLHHGPGGWLIVLAVYGAVMWKTKGTTIGGIVCGLKVVRVDNREIDWATAFVRALGCFLSLAVAGLGFIWVAIDDERQSWHDKIAGTTVVHVPKGVSLL